MVQRLVQGTLDQDGYDVQANQRKGVTVVAHGIGSGYCTYFPTAHASIKGVILNSEKSKLKMSKFSCYMMSMSSKYYVSLC